MSEGSSPAAAGMRALSRHHAARAAGEGAHIATSALSGRGHVLVSACGYEPVGYCCAASVWTLSWPYRRPSVGGEIRYLTAALSNARSRALRDLEEQARRLGATGVIGVDVRMHPHGRHVEFRAAGTAIKSRAAKATGELWLACLGAADLYRLAVAGWKPCGIAVGQAVVGVAPVQLATVLRRVGRNVEMAEPTNAVREARKLAMTRLTDHALKVGADGVVAVDLRIIEHLGAANLLEILAVGTCIRQISSDLNIPDIRVVVSVGRH